jgi:hypothetical protein
MRVKKGRLPFAFTLPVVPWLFVFRRVEGVVVSVTLTAVKLSGAPGLSRIAGIEWIDLALTFTAARLLFTSWFSRISGVSVVIIAIARIGTRAIPKGDRWGIKIWQGWSCCVEDVFDGVPLLVDAAVRELAIESVGHNSSVILVEALPESIILFFRGDVERVEEMLGNEEEAAVVF